MAKTATAGDTMIIIRKEGGNQEGRGINKILLRRKLFLIIMVIPLVRSVGRSTQGIVVLGLLLVSCVAKKATLLRTVALIPRIHRTSRGVKGINFMQPR